jgi:hypothetical protein
MGGNEHTNVDDVLVVVFGGGRGSVADPLRPRLRQLS